MLIHDYAAKLATSAHELLGLQSKPVDLYSVAQLRERQHFVGLRLELPNGMFVDVIGHDFGGRVTVELRSKGHGLTLQKITLEKVAEPVGGLVIMALAQYGIEHA